MKQNRFILLSFLVFDIGNLFAQEKDYLNSNEMRLQQIKNIHNHELWNMERLKEDITSTNKLLPIQFSAFPVPDYDKVGPYKGGGLVGTLQTRSLEGV